MSLTATEYHILELLMRRSPAVVDRKAIAEHAWADETDPLGSNAIDVQMSRLRAKLPERRRADRHRAGRRLPAGGGVNRRLERVNVATLRVALIGTGVVALVYTIIAVAVVVFVTNNLTAQVDNRLAAALTYWEHSGPPGPASVTDTGQG